MNTLIDTWEQDIFEANYNPMMDDVGMFSLLCACLSVTIIAGLIFNKKQSMIDV
jgi:hypothetical protein